MYCFVYCVLFLFYRMNFLLTSVHPIVSCDYRFYMTDVVNNIPFVSVFFLSLHSW